MSLTDTCIAAQKHLSEDWRPLPKGPLPIPVEDEGIVYARFVDNTVRRINFRDIALINSRYLNFITHWMPLSKTQPLYGVSVSLCEHEQVKTDLKKAAIARDLHWTRVNQLEQELKIEQQKSYAYSKALTEAKDGPHWAEYLSMQANVRGREEENASLTAQRDAAQSALDESEQLCRNQADTIAHYQEMRKRFDATITAQLADQKTIRQLQFDLFNAKAAQPLILNSSFADRETIRQLNEKLRFNENSVKDLRKMLDYAKSQIDAVRMTVG